MRSVRYHPEASAEFLHEVEYYAAISAGRRSTPTLCLMTDTLSTSLRREIQDAWRTLRARNPEHRFYAFGLYANDVASWFGAVACTEEGLDQVAASYAAKRGADLNLERCALRWSMADSPLLGDGLALLPQTQAIREAEPDPYSDEEGAEAATEGFFAAAKRALKEMDEAGEFGEGAVRESIVVSVWLNDESDEDILATARELNSEQVARRYAEELHAGHQAFFAGLDRGGANEA